MKYTALTIGPIIKSLGLAHKTRELWTASYFFSSLMEKTISNLHRDDAIVIPYPKKGKLIDVLSIDKNLVKSAGIFPDHLLLESKNGLFEKLKNAVEISLQLLHQEFGFSCSVEQLKNYFSTHIIEFEYEPRMLENKEDNIIFQTSDFLANCELQANYIAEDKECLIKMFERIAETSLYKKIFNKNILGTKGFPSILEISTQGLNTSGITLDDDTIEDELIWEKLKDINKDMLKVHHKYIAIIQADGDSIGEIIKYVAKDGIGSLKEFTAALSSFSLLAAQAIAKYKGIPVYAGGDDLLFFAPVSNGKENIFQLIEQLDGIFEEQVTKRFSATNPKASMSYGVSISYYKFPMHEALNTARNLLFIKAKEKPKNAVAVKIQKHSGQVFEAVFHKPLDKKFSDLLSQDKGLVINSLLYGFDRYKVLLKESLDDKTDAQLENFFKNFYNEDIHKKSEDFIDDVKELLKNAYINNNKDFAKTINQVFSQLQFVKFLNTKKDD